MTESIMPSRAEGVESRSNRPYRRKYIILSR